MKMISAVLVSLIGFSANASTSVEKYGQHDNVPETTASVSTSYNTIHFLGRVLEDTCVNTPKHTQCGSSGATAPVRVEQNYSFGTIVTLTYL